MRRPPHICACPPRDRIPNADTNACWRCGGELVRAPEHEEAAQ